MKQIVVHQEKCTACRECELACSFSHEGSFIPTLSRIRIADFYEEQFYQPMVCVHCADVPCAAGARLWQSNVKQTVRSWLSKTVVSAAKCACLRVPSA